MTPQRMRDAAQILGELGNGKMANELMTMAEHAEKGTVHQGALAAVAALKQADATLTREAAELRTKVSESRAEEVRLGVELAEARRERDGLMLRIDHLNNADKRKGQLDLGIRLFKAREEIEALRTQLANERKAAEALRARLAFLQSKVYKHTESDFWKDPFYEIRFEWKKTELLDEAIDAALATAKPEPAAPTKEGL